MTRPGVMSDRYDAARLFLLERRPDAIAALGAFGRLTGWNRAYIAATFWAARQAGWRSYLTNPANSARVLHTNPAVPGEDR